MYPNRREKKSHSHFIYFFSIIPSNPLTFTPAFNIMALADTYTTKVKLVSPHSHSLHFTEHAKRKLYNTFTSLISHRQTSYQFNAQQNALGC